MSEWAPKRFWTEVSVVPEEGGHGIRLDGRPLRTPGKAPLVLPTRALAQAVADEWAAVDKLVDPAAMPMTRRANSAIDKVTPQFAEVAELIGDYGASDLLCYRDGLSDELAEAQAAAWDPLLDWSRDMLGAPLATTRGVAPVDQPEASVERLREAVRGTTPFELTALHDLVSLSGSLVLGLAATEPAAAAEHLWNLSRFDEDWQARRWGTDDEATRDAAARRRDFLDARKFWTLVRDHMQES